MTLTWDSKIGPAQVIQIILLVSAIIGGGFSFYYQSKATSAKVDELGTQITEIKKDVKDLSDSIDDNDKAMRILVDSSGAGIKTEINLLRTDVVKITVEQNGLQRQIDDLKERLRREQ